MPAKLFLQLRVLNHPSLPSACVVPMKLGVGPPMSSSAASFSRLFPFRLKYHCLGFHRAPMGQTDRRFSTRTTRPRSELSAGRPSKSLIDDEAELSDWVSDLKDDSPHGGRDDSDGDWGGSSSRASVRDGGGSGIGRDSYSGKRMRTSESESGEFGRPSRQRESARAPAGKFSRSPPTNRGFDGGDKFQRNSQTNRQFDTKRGNGDRGDFSRRKSPRFPREDDGFARNSQLNRRSDTKWGGEEREFSSHNKSPRFEEGKFGSKSTMGKRAGGRDMEFGSKKSGLDSIKSQRFLSKVDSEDEDEIRGGDKLAIEDLLSDEDSDTNEEEDGDDDDVGNVLAKETSKGLAKASSGNSESYLSDTRFDQVSVSPLSLKGIKDAGFERMTVVQEATLPVILKGKDVLAKAKTGTGKTVAFLLPSIEVIVNSPPIGRDQKRPPIYVLVICPTRELACQAAAEANTLLKYHPFIGVQVVIGGTRLALEQKRMQANPCQILVATPGRLRDHMENTAGFATRLMGVKVLVLDEADHLLDMGFRKDIERIIAAVPKQRQTLLFSATVPEEVRQVCHIALKRDHEFINTVQGGSEDTHSQVSQMHLVAPLDKQFSLLYALLKEHIADDVDYKVIVFCTTAMVTRLVAELLGELNMNVREIHSRKSQSYRTKVSDEFRKSKGLILVTSDVSARGVDYPDVTLVIQVGLPADKQQYIHRLGRTGRKGKEGEGVLLLTPWEEFFLSTIKDLPIRKAPEPSVDPDTRKRVERALSNLEMKSKESAYQAWLGYYNSNKTVGRDKHRLVELANEFSRSMGLDNPPAIPKLVLGKMGLKNVPGLRSR